MTPFIIDCWIDNVILNYDNVTRRTTNQPGVETRVPGWGDPAVVEFLDPSQHFISATLYFNYLVKALVEVGYERNTTVRAAPYDFRKGPAENSQWFADLRHLIEASFSGTAVTLICHSMGCLMSLLFLQQQSAEWKEKYIMRYITLAGAWGGSVKSVKVFALGDAFGAFALKDSTMREEQISMPSLAFLLPSPHFWNSSDVIVSTPKREYSVADLEDFFTDIGYPTGWEMRKDMMPFLNFTPPEVETYCLYGTQLPTIEALSYGGDIQTSKPALLTGNGDGTVNLRSLRGCNGWVGQQKQKVFVTEIPNADHYYFLGSPDVIEKIVQIVVM